MARRLSRVGHGLGPWRCQAFRLMREETTPQWLMVASQRWEPAHGEAVGLGAAGTSERSVAAPQHVAYLVRDIHGHPVEPVHRGAWRIAVKNWFHISTVGQAAASHAALRRRVRAPPLGVWDGGPYSLDRQALLSRCLDDGASFEDALGLLTWRLEFDGETDRR